MFTLTLIDPKPEMYQAWLEAFAAHPEVNKACGYFQDVPAFDCMVSAANSFGLMDGGVDLAITNFFGTQLEQRVQQHIIDH
ncbi:MAG: macro domain-containing protein, partial [Bacteroidota bacterium]